MIYTPPPDTFSYLEPYDEIEKFAKRYWEIKGDDEEFKKLVNFVKYSANPILQNALDSIMQNIESLTLFEDFYVHKVTVWKHPRFMKCHLHNHNFFEMVYVLKGKVDNIIRNQLYKMSEGDICLLAPNVYHKLKVFDDSLIINIIMKKSLFEEQFLSRFLPENNIIKFIKQNFYTPPYRKTRLSNNSFPT